MRPLRTIPPNVWTEIASIHSVQRAYGLDTSVDPGAQLASVSYGAAFEAASPGYTGDLYVVQDDVLGGLAMTFYRRADGQLSRLFMDRETGERL